VALKEGLHDQKLSDPGELQAGDMLAFRKKFRVLPVMTYDNDMSNLRGSFCCQLSFADDTRDALFLPPK
jgi:hypothetical protein